MAVRKNKEDVFLSFHLRNTRNAAILSFVVYFLFIFAVAWFAIEELFTVFIGFSPVFIFLLLMFVLFYLDLAIAELVYLLPIALSAIFYGLWFFDVSIVLSGMNGPMLTVLNIIVSFVFAAVLSILHPQGVDKVQGGLGFKIEHPAPIVKDSKEDINFETTHAKPVPSVLKLPDKPMSVTIRGIEDKCKAINFVIGRVYSAKRGGSKEIRGMIGIPKELYNAFSELVQGDEVVDNKRLLGVVEQISGRLNQLDTKESELFDLKRAKIEVDRAENGSDTVLSVLSRNDKDPVEEYRSEALEVCSQVIEYLKMI